MWLYRLLVSLITPVVLIRFVLRRWRGLDAPGALTERLGGGDDRATGPTIWVHGASVGELAATRAIIETALRRDPALSIILTCNTETGRASARGWGLDRLIVTLAPLDHRVPVSRFLQRWHPLALITIENEIWPNRFATCQSRGIPVLLIGARLSEKSAKVWQRFGSGLSRRVFGAIRFLGALDDPSKARFRALGVSDAAIGPNLLLKGDVSLPPVDATEIARLAQVFAPDRTVLAASTHAGEEEPVLAAFAEARRTLPELRLILAPRHPDRGDEVAALIAAAGLSCARRSRGEAPGPAAVYLADTLGEMGLWFRLAGVTFMGGSLVPKGGHTPFEPVQFDTALLHGPDISNNAAAYQALAACDGAVEVDTPAAIAAAIVTLASDGARRAEMVRAARAALGGLSSDDTARNAFWQQLAALCATPALAR